MDDLDAIAAIAAGPAGAGAAAEGEGPVVAYDADLDALALIAGGPPGGQQPPQKYEQRGWQLLAKARDSKKRKQLEREKEDALAKAARANSQLSLLGVLAPGVARSVGIVIHFLKGGETDEVAAEWARLTAIVAFRATGHESDSYTLLRQGAVSLVAAAALRRQASFVTQFFGPPAQAGDPEISGLQPTRHLSLS